MKILGKTLKDYILPIKYHILCSVLVVISQYYVALPLSSQYPFLLNVTQALWALIVALAVIKLVKEYNFEMDNIIVVGILFSIIIHGLKAFFFRIFLFPYTRIPSDRMSVHLVGEFLYGSFLVMVIAIVIGAVFIYAKRKNLLK